MKLPGKRAYDTVRSAVSDATETAREATKATAKAGANAASKVVTKAVAKPAAKVATKAAAPKATTNKATTSKTTTSKTTTSKAAASKAAASKAAATKTVASKAPTANITIQGTAQKGLKTKDLIKRLAPDDIAVINHVDIDRVSADGLVATGVRAVINADKSTSGRYPNVGPQIIVDAGIVLLDAVGPELFDVIDDGDSIRIEGNKVYRVRSEQNDEKYDDASDTKDEALASGVVLDTESITASFAAAEERVNTELEQFVKNTAQYLEKQSVSLIYDPWIPTIDTPIKGRHALVVARGYDYQRDIQILVPYIRDAKPVLIAVDGGADALLENGFKPDIILGDMDSVTDKALRCGAEIIAHAYEDETCPSKKRLDELGIEAKVWPLAGTSEDLGLLLAWEKKADLIVALGTHSNLVEYLDKGRSGMASSFLVRLKVGTKLVDAKGVSKLYRAAPPMWQMFVVLLAALLVIITVIALSEPIRNIFIIIWLNIRANLGI
ncbi:MAG: putative cytokinetic ring protein SteA [Coriobacteriia bacterium]|nr:putative cytokinetic ring protein SteA [Coriobacteriia bacterium]